MGRWLALLSTASLILGAAVIDPCKRQPFRGRCPSVESQTPKRSQFVLRYYARNGECVSYPYGHCASDDSEPQLYRYKEECEDSCINNTPENLGQPKTEESQTYGTVSPLKEPATVDRAEHKVVTSERFELTTELTSVTAPPTTASTTKSTTITTTEEVTTTEATTTESTTTEKVTTTAKATTTVEATTDAPTTIKHDPKHTVTEKGEPEEEEENNVEEEVQETTAASTTAQTSTTSTAKTECERRLEASASSKIRGGFVPVCDSNGSFQKVQCEPDGRQCFCVSANGIEITNSRTRNGVKPDCARIETAVSPRTQVCTGRSDRGPCSSAYTRFYFDESTQKCNTFSFSGCGGNGNNYETEAECNRRCMPAKPATTTAAPIVIKTNDICSLPKERGPCDKYELRFYYNSDTKECKYFFWGGCEGNGNNFETAESCQSACGVAKGVRIGNGSHDELEVVTTQATSTTAAPTPSTTRFVSQPVTNRAPVPPQPQPQTTQRFVQPTTAAPKPPSTAAPVTPPRPQVVLPGDDDADSANRCAHPLDSGSCRGTFVRWFWDNRKSACDVFTYSGCEGNGNNFASNEECMAICHKELATPPPAPDFSNVCKHDIDAGECQGVFQRFAFDTEEDECRPFTYGGCGGNGNNFATIAECRTKCEKPQDQTVNVCEFEIEAGECTGVFPRFAYDRETNDCRSFTYGGCGGNGNNFANINECRNICIRKSCQPVGQCDLGRCQIVNDNRGCPFCSCSPVKLPVPNFNCPTLDIHRCQDPCIVITNRRGCQECTCPKLPSTLVPPVELPEGRAPGFHTPQTALPPATPDRVGPPASPSRPSEPVRTPMTIPGIQENKPALPNSLAELTEKCLQPMESGPCKNFVDRWFFNKEDGTCHPFKYGGCAGNRNHFFTQRECEIHCARFLKSTTAASRNASTEAPTTRTTHAPTMSTTTQARPTPTEADIEGQVPDFNENDIKKEQAGVLNVAVEPEIGIGRQPIPIGSVNLPDNTDDIDLKGLEEPTTIFPVTKGAPTVRPTTSQAPTTRVTLPVVQNTQAQTIKKFDSHDPRIICAMSADPGICDSYVGRWFFNSETGQCEQFSFGGCGGNLNNFVNRTLCELSCMTAHPAFTSQVPERCSYDKDAGYGKGYNVKWYFNMRNLRCEQFVFEGKGGNSNQFETLSDCERFCSPQPARTQTIRPTLPTIATIPTALPVITRPPQTVAPAPVPTTAPLPPRPLAPLPIETTTEENDEYVDDGDDAENLPSMDNIPVSSGLIPPPSLGNEVARAPGTEPQPPAAQAAKTVTHKNAVDANKLNTVSQASKAAPTPVKVTPAPTVATTQKVEQTTYKTERINTDTAFRVDPNNLLANLPIVGPSPREDVNYQTGQSKAHGLPTHDEGRLPPPDINDAKNGDEKVTRPSCPNGNKELRYSDGRSVQCLPGKQQCPNKSVCYFNGMDYFCCPTTEDPYDRHVFGGYGGEEARNGYKVFGPLRIRRLMDEVPLRAKRQTSMDRAFNTNPASFNLDSVVAPLRFDAEKPKHVFRAARMRKPTPPRHGNPMCILPLIKGDCDAAHLRYYYDRNSDSCRLFYYSGCQGNANNFGSLEDCQRLCVLGGQIAPAVQADAVTPVSIVSPGQCPNGAPLGGSAPVLCGNSTESIGCPTGFYCRPGPPDICCPGVDPNQKNPVQHGVKVAQEITPKPGVPRSYYKQQLISTPQYMCPDASDPLMAENGMPAVCGAGFDGVKMCPKGYYCAIDGAKGSRLCCPLFGSTAHRIPTESILAPQLPRRNHNPEEIIDRGSLPSDQQLYDKKVRKTLSEATELVAKTTEAPEYDEGEEDDDDDAQHLKMKPGTRHEQLQNEAASQSPKATEISSETGNIDVSKEQPAVEEPAQPTETSAKQANDKSICQLKPTEGRACREDEKAPRTNLHYFYSAKDRRCKLYFYRGCGGNANRFEKKADCEALCLKA